MKLRKFSKEGVEAFRELLLDHQLILDKPDEFLTRIRALSVNDGLSKEIQGEIELKPFSDRFEFAKYLFESIQEVLSEYSYDTLTGDTFFWNWLAAAWLPILIEADTRPELLDKIGESKDAARWILINDKTRFHRHLISGPYFAFEANVENLDRARVLFAMFPDNKTGNVLKSGELWERLVGKTALSSGVIVHLATLMFVNSSTYKLHPNAGDKRQGAQAFSKYFSQIDLTLDYHGMDVETLMNILPKHFQKWLPEARKSLSLERR